MKNMLVAKLNVEDIMKPVQLIAVGMKKLLFLLFAFWLSPAFAGSHYVAANGNDANEGTAHSPWATILNAMRKAQPGDTIFVRGGTYTEGEIWIQRTYGMGGKNGRYVTISAYPGERPIFTDGNRGLIIDASYVRVIGLEFQNGKSMYNVDWSGPTDHVEFIGNRFSGIFGYEAIGITGDHNLVEGNIIHLSGNTTGTLGHGIYATRGKYTVIRGNVISGATGFGIHLYDERRSGDAAGSIRQIKNIVIENNFISASRQRSGIIVGAGADGGPAHIDSVIVRYNVVFNNPMHGILIGGWSEVKNIHIYHNTICGNGDNGIQIFQRQVKNVTINNNIIAVNNGKRHIDNAPNAPGVVIERNLYHPPTIALNNAQDNKPRRGDPLFVDPEKNDFRLQKGSPAIDAGINWGQPFKGAAPDLGAFESDETNNAPAIPAAFELRQNYPNPYGRPPFNEETEISFGLPVDAVVELTIFNVMGQRVKTLVQGLQTAGWKTVVWNSKNDADFPVTSGVYFYRLRTKDFSSTRSMLYLK